MSPHSASASLRRPTDGDVARFLARAAQAPLSYQASGAAIDRAPPGYDYDHTRVQLGRGDAVYERARAALREWRMFPAPWAIVRAVEGDTVCVQIHVLGLWWLNGARIVARYDDQAAVRRCGIAYATLACHVESGEEHFVVEQLADGSVWYDLRACSRPEYFPARVAKPLARALQRRFVRDSQRALRAAAATSSSAT
ncbi:MAG: DUF1990 domain-containing protein [Planctomycetota bacterium]|nr:MAG: DUF1990 domain-containing protein [Planctomycetota bacterium]